MNRQLSVEIRGKLVDENTRCVHYHGPDDIIALKFKCCGIYYPCYSCHEEEAGHVHVLWKKNEFDTKAVLCGVCRQELTINEYLKSDHRCPSCKSAFNPGCSKHYGLYFEL